MITSPSTPATTRYLQPGWVTRHVFNPFMAVMTKSGTSIRGSRVLHVQGRTTGEWRTVPVNPLTIDGRQYLVAPRGETQWVRNMRVAGGGKLQLGRRRSEFTATEMTDAAAKARVLQQYLQLWKAEVGAFFAGVDATSLDALTAIADGYPVFTIDSTPAS